MTSKEKAAAIRRELKDKYGWTARQVGVRCRSCNYSSSIEVTIKDPKVKAHLVRPIVEQFAHVRRCEMSGDILAGGNTFTRISYDDALVRAKTLEVVPLLSDEPGRAVEIGPFSAARENAHWKPELGVYTFWRTRGDLNEDVRCYGKQAVGNALADALMDGGFVCRGRWVGA